MIDKLFEHFYMTAEQIFSMFSGFVGCAWLPSDKLFRNHNDFLLFQGFQVAGQISVGQFEELFQCIEIKRVVHHERRHNSKPDAAFKYFLQI